MGGPVRDQYHDDLDAITASLVDITRLAGRAINQATQALLDADLQAAESVISGDTAIDDYAWLAGKDDPATIAYLKAENAYTEELTAGLTPLRDRIFGEIKGRTKETDLSVPVRKGGWWHYGRTVEGKQYQVHCRRRVQQILPNFMVLFPFYPHCR